MGKKQILIVVVVVLVVVGVIGTVFAMSGSDDNHSNSDHSDDTSKTSEANPSTASTQNSATPSTESNQAASDAVAVEISNFAYSPATLTVKVGTTVTWTNRDSVRHDVAADNESSDAPSSELLGRGESYSFTFKKAGTYSYHCTPHPNMQAKVIVTE